MDKTGIAKIFIPMHCINQCQITKGTVLYGSCSIADKTICFINNTNHDSVQVKKHQIFIEGSNTCEILGLMTDNIDGYNHLPRGTESDMMLIVTIDRDGVPKCMLKKSLLQLLDVDESIVILYDVEKLKKSSYISEVTEESHILNHLFGFLRIHEQIMKPNSAIKNKNSWNTTNLLNINDLNYFYKHLFTYLCLLLNLIGNLSYVKMPQSNWLCSQPAIYEQLKRKYDDSVTTMKEYCQYKQSKNEMKMKNVLWRNTTDIILGVTVLYWFISDISYSHMIADNIMNIAQTAAAELQSLLKWLMGVPAGLKLNSQLAEFLGKFFFYHIHVWTSYLGILKPVLSSTLWYIALCGCMGFSIQVALVQDLLSMMTLHIYCFYVYAARLYNFQMSGLSSLWRLFRGKKWNSLRQRVDSAQYNIDQLFIGTLLFTILLFLLPTAALFYIVFLALRLAVLILQGSLYQLISIINNIPIYFLLMKIFNPDTLINDVEFHVIRKSKSSYFVMELKSASINELFEDGKMQESAKETHDWSSFVKKIVSGQFIYPWKLQNKNSV